MGSTRTRTREEQPRPSLPCPGLPSLSYLPFLPSPRSQRSRDRGQAADRREGRNRPRGRATRSVSRRYTECSRGERDGGETSREAPSEAAGRGLHGVYPGDTRSVSRRYTACSSETPPKRATGAGQTGPYPARPRPRPSRGLGVSRACPLAIWHEACTIRGVPRRRRGTGEAEPDLKTDQGDQE